MTRSVRARTSKDVLEDHLRRRKDGDLEGDIANNYNPDVCLLSAEGVHHGHDGVRALAAVLRRHLPHGDYAYRQVQFCCFTAFGLVVTVALAMSYPWLRQTALA